MKKRSVEQMKSFHGCSVDPAAFGLQRVEEIVQRVCLTLDLSDPGRILSLLRSLYENSADILQIKINKYLAEVTDSDTVFMVMDFLKKNEHRVTVVGEKILPLEILLEPNSEMIQDMEEKASEIKAFELPLEYLDDRLQETIETYVSATDKYKEKPYELKGALVVPFRHPISQKILLYVVLINTSRTIDYKRIKCGLVTECIRYCEGVIVSSLSFAVEKLDHERARDFIELMRQILLNIENLKKLIDEMRLRLCDLFYAERCAIFLRDENCKYFITKILDFGEPTDLAEPPAKNIKLPEDFGLVGIVAKTGEIINCKDTETDPRYCDDLDLKLGVTTKTVLCFPLRNGDDIIGCVEMYNKVPSKQSDVFTDRDVDSATALSSMLPPLILHCLHYKKLKQSINRSDFVNSLYLKKQPPTQSEVDEVLKCQVVHNVQDMLSLSFSQLSMDDGQYDHLACIIYEFFNNFGLIRRFNIRPGVFVRFLLSVIKEQPNLPFHNWMHSFATFQFAAVLVKDLSLVENKHCTQIEVLALLIAALCHCVDFKGSISKFQVSSGMTLAALYSSPGQISQQCQSSQLFRLLNQPETNILENVPDEQFQTFCCLIKKLVKVADMGFYRKQMERTILVMAEGLDREDLDQRLLLLSLLMVCSVLNDYSKDFAHCRRTGEMTLAEFLPEVDATDAQGIFDLDQFTPNVELIPHLQIQFMNEFCLPSFKLLSELFPVTYLSYQRCQENMFMWDQYKDKFNEILVQELVSAELAHE